MDGPITIDSARCAHETVDGETMVIDTTTGHLLLLGGIGVHLWEHLRRTTTRDHLVSMVTGRYGALAGAEASAFVDELAASGLVIAGPPGDGVASVDAAPDADGSTGPEWPAEFESPVLERFEDIADIMAMDPIHEVDTSLGWPTAGTGPVE
jgi:hypothetical protein